jgi:hypothetical protein
MTGTETGLHFCHHQVFKAHQLVGHKVATLIQFRNLLRNTWPGLQNATQAYKAWINKHYLL